MRPPESDADASSVSLATPKPRASKPASDFWSAAGTIFSQQNRIPRLTRSTQDGPPPLSLAQERLYLLEGSESGAPYYHVPLTWEISGTPNLFALEQSLDLLVQRHEILRTTFPTGPAGPVQKVNDWHVKLPLIDLTTMPAPKRSDEATRLATELVRTPFDLTRDNLFRAAIYRRGTHDHWLVVVVHQMVFDGTSMRIFSRELADCYRAFSEGRAPQLDPVPVRYTDFSLWQRQCLIGEPFDTATAFWRAQLQKRYEPLRFQTDQPRCNIGITPGALVPVHLPKELIAGLKHLGADLGISSFAAFLGSFQAFLGRLTGQDDILALVSIAARNQSDLRNVIGLLANVLPMRLDLSGKPGLAQVLERSGQAVSSALAHQILPLGSILELLPSSGANVSAPALQILVVYNNAPLPVLSFSDATFSPAFELDNGTSKFDFILDVADSPQGVVGHLKYRSDLFTPASINRFLLDWQTFVSNAVQAPNLAIESVALTPETDARPLPARPVAEPAMELLDAPATASFTHDRVGARAENLVTAADPPRNALERSLARAWEKVFDIHPIGIHDNFFGLGGHSLIAVKLIAAIEQETGTKLRLCKIFQEPTIARLATAMERREAISGSSIVEIQPHGTKPPIFFVHGVGGGMFWGYSNLARHLGQDQPVYAFRSRGMDGLEEFSQIEEMAAHYVADLRKFQPQGPYRLGGYCFGGNVAYEMARQLRLQGQEVPLLLLMNCWPNNSSYTKLSFTPMFFVRAIWNFLIRLDHQIKSGAKQPRDFFKWRASWLRKRIKSFFSKNSSARLGVDDIVDLSSRPEQERTLWRTHVQAWLQFQPKPYDGQIVLFRTRGHPLVCSYDHRMGWGSFASRGVAVRTCPGDHETILEEENVATTAGELKSVLAALDSSVAQACSLPLRETVTQPALGVASVSSASVPAVGL